MLRGCLLYTSSKNAASAPAASQTQTGGSGTANSQPSQGNTENAKPADGACPICGSTDFVNGQCQTIHDYTGYGHCTYDAATGTVYVVCSSCGQSWPRSSFSDPSAFVNGHALACYAQHHKTYITCIPVSYTHLDVYKRQVTVFRCDAHHVEVFIRSPGIVYGRGVDVEKEFQKFTSGQKLRNGRRGQHIADVLARQFPARSVFLKKKAAAVAPDVPVQTVEQLSLIHI